MQTPSSPPCKHPKLAGDFTPVDPQLLTILGIHIPTNDYQAIKQAFGQALRQCYAAPGQLQIPARQCELIATWNALPGLQEKVRHISPLLLSQVQQGGKIKVFHLLPLVQDAVAARATYSPKSYVQVSEMAATSPQITPAIIAERMNASIRTASAGSQVGLVDKDDLIPIYQQPMNFLLPYAIGHYAVEMLISRENILGYYSQQEIFTSTRVKLGSMPYLFIKGSPTTSSSFIPLNQEDILAIHFMSAIPPGSSLLSGSSSPIIESAINEGGQLQIQSTFPLNQLVNY